MVLSNLCLFCWTKSMFNKLFDKLLYLAWIIDVIMVTIWDLINELNVQQVTKPKSKTKHESNLDINDNFVQYIPPKSTNSLKGIVMNGWINFCRSVLKSATLIHISRIPGDGDTGCVNKKHTFGFLSPVKNEILSKFKL